MCFRLVPLRDLAAGGRQLKTLLLSIHLSTPPLLFLLRLILWCRFAQHAVPLVQFVDSPHLIP